MSTPCFPPDTLARLSMLTEMIRHSTVSAGEDFHGAAAVRTERTVCCASDHQAERRSPVVGMANDAESSISFRP